VQFRFEFDAVLEPGNQEAFADDEGASLLLKELVPG
jgi:hypothetical protein